MTRKNSPSKVQAIKDKIANLRIKTITLLEAEGPLSTVEISNRFDVDPNTLGTMLRKSPLSFTIVEDYNVKNKRRLVSMRLAASKSMC